MSLSQQFRKITSALAAEASAYLDKHNGNLNAAVDAYYASVPSEALKELWERYHDANDQESILIDGTLQYLADLGLAPEDLRCLTLAFLLRSPQTGEFSRDDFFSVWGANGIDSLKGMRSYIDKQHYELRANRNRFEQFYRYVFDFVRGRGAGKTLPAPDAAAYWHLLFIDSVASNEHQDEVLVKRVEQWCEFVENAARPVTRDTWNMWLRFYYEVMEPAPKTLAAYNEMDAWPSLVDEYVDWLRERSAIMYMERED